MKKAKKTKKDTQKNKQNGSGTFRKRVASLFEPVRASRKVLLLMVIVAITSILVTSLISVALNRFNNLYLPSAAVIKTIEVEAYWDPECQYRRDSIDWGEIQPGMANDTIVYIKSVSNFEVSLNLNLTNWSPPDITDYITITWDYDGTRLSPGDVIPITLSMSSSSSTNFIEYLVENKITDFDVEVHFIATV